MPKHSTERRWFSGWRLYLVLGLCSALPLSLFLYAADRLRRRNTTIDLVQISERSAVDAGNLLEENLAEIRASLQAIVALPLTRDAWARGDLRSLSNELQEGHEVGRQKGYLAMYNAKGTLLAIYPSSASPGIDPLSPRWIASFKKDQRWAISGVFPMAAPNRLAVAVMVPMDHPSGALVGIYTLDTVKLWLHGTPESITKWVRIVDQNGAAVFAPGLNDAGPLQDLTGQDEVKKVLAGQNGTGLGWYEGRQSLISRRPLASCGWGLLIEIPMEEIDKAIWEHERPVVVLGAAFLLVAAVIGAVIAGLYRKLRESEQHTRQVVTSAMDAFIAVDAEGKVTDLNPQAELLFGWPSSDALGQPLHLTIIPLRYRKSYLRSLKRVQVTGQGPLLERPLELSVLHHDGHEFPVEVSMSHIRKGRKDYFCAFLRDISERKDAEKKVADLNMALHAQIEQLVERNREVEAFSYSVSHDVSAPLRHIASFSKLLAEECGDQITPEGQGFLERIQNGAERLQRLVSDLLRLSRLGQQGLRWQPICLSDVVMEVIAALRRDLNDRNISFEIAPLPSIECDHGLITQVFWNLLSNAVKFTATRQRAVVSVGECRQGDENVLFVKDNGVGFDMRYAQNLFRAFQRLHGSEFEGNGIGLATVERIILKHNGRIWAQAEPEAGAAFFFTLGGREVKKKAAPQATKITEAVQYD